MKLKLADLLAIAQKRGYTGPADDADKVRAHLVALTDPAIVIKADGQTIDLKTVEIEGSVATKTTQPDVINLSGITEVKSSVGAGDTLPADIDQRVKAGVEAAMKSAGWTPAGRHNPSQEVTAVKSAAEGMYETKIRRKQAVFSSFKNAMVFADYMLAKVYSRDPKAAADYSPQIEAARKRLIDGGVMGKDGAIKAYATTPTAAGGAFVPEILHADVLANLLQHGKTRQLSKVVPMQSDRDTLPYKTGIHTLSYPQEGSAPSSTTTGVTYGNISLQARMGTAYTKVTRSLNMDAIVNVMDDQATELIRCVAYSEDNAFINGTGALATGGMVGIISKFGTLGTTTSNYVTGGGDWSAHSMANMTSLLGKIPDYARANSVWLCTPEFSGTVLSRLSAAQGGVTWKETADYGYVQMFLGRPVVNINTMNATASTGSSTVDVIFGDFSRAVLFGDRMAPEIDVSDQRFWEENNLGIKVTVRHDINWWDPTSAIAYLYQT